MKLRAIFTLILIYTACYISAQDFFAGPVLGASFTQVDGDSYAGFNKAGLKVGGFVGRSLSDLWDVQMEIIYIQKGSRKTPDVKKGDYADYSIQLDYIQFPLIARYKLNKFSFEGGASYGVLLNSVEKVNGDLIPEDSRVPFQKNELASIFSVNYQITDRLKINARYSYSLYRIRIPYNGEIPIYDPYWDRRKPGQYNHVVNFSFYYNLFQNY